MLEIIKERTPVTVTDYRIEFHYKDDPEAGYSFPANKDRTPALDKMSKDAMANYESCLTDNRFTGAEFITNTRSYTEPAVGRCSCGSEVILASSYMGAVQCNCGKWYNVFGQSLKDPKYWKEEW